MEYFVYIYSPDGILLVAVGLFMKGKGVRGLLSIIFVHFYSI